MIRTHHGALQRRERGRWPTHRRGGAVLPVWIALLALLTVVGAPASARAQETGEPDGGHADCCPLLLLPVGARATSMGGATVALAGVDAVFANPAGLAPTSRTTFVVHHWDQSVGPQINAFSLLVPAFSSVFGLSYELFDNGSIVTTDINRQPTGELTLRDHLLVASFGTDLGAGLSAGVNYRLFQQRIDCQGACGSEENVATTHGADFGVLYRPPWSSALSLGVSVMDVGFGLQVENAAQADPLPTRLHIGAAYNLLAGVPTDSLLALRVSGEITGGLRAGAEYTPSVGLELDMQDLIFLRAGYTPGEGLATGAAVGVELHYDRFDIAVSRSFVNSSLAADTEPYQISFAVAF